jgi:hypothetical protein
MFKFKNHLCEFRHNRSPNYQISRVREILGNKREYNAAVLQLYIDSKQVCASVKKGVYCEPLVGIVIPQDHLGLFSCVEVNPMVKSG